MIDIKSIVSTASQHRSSIFSALLTLPHDAKYLGYLVTQKAKELGLVDETRKNLKGNTLSEWSKSHEIDGRNTPNAWACTAAVHLILDYGCVIKLTEEELDTFSYYLSQNSDNEDAFFQAKALVSTSLLPKN